MASPPTLREALAFAASVIKSGEPWTAECERIIGAALAAPDEGRPPGEACTGLAATWCPIHGNCKCPDFEERDHPDCPLHSARSEHGAAPASPEPEPALRQRFPFLLDWLRLLQSDGPSPAINWRMVAGWALTALAASPEPRLETPGQRYDRLLGEMDDLWREMSPEERGASHARVIQRRASPEPEGTRDPNMDPCECGHSRIAHGSGGRQCGGFLFEGGVKGWCQCQRFSELPRADIGPKERAARANAASEGKSLAAGDGAHEAAAADGSTSTHRTPAPEGCFCDEPDNHSDDDGPCGCCFAAGWEPCKHGRAPSSLAASPPSPAPREPLIGQQAPLATQPICNEAGHAHVSRAEARRCAAKRAPSPAPEPAPEQRQLPCGCITCVCEDPEQCHGCGAKEAPRCYESRMMGSTRHAPLPEVFVCDICGCYQGVGIHYEGCPHLLKPGTVTYRRAPAPSSPAPKEKP